MLKKLQSIFHLRKQVYLDHAAATPLLPEVVKVMRATEAAHFANPSAVHQAGLAARVVIESAREKLARVLRIRPIGVIFTASGSESNNLAIYGSLKALVESGRSFSELEVIATQLEHPSVDKVLVHLVSLGVTVHYLPVDEDGLVLLSELTPLLNDRTALVTCAYVNSEIGVIQPIGKICRLVKKFNQQNGTSIMVHTDAAQAPYWLPCQLDQLGVDLMSLDAGKCGGPKGVGVLATRHGVNLVGVLLGGGQENGLRAGTENTVGIIGAVEAIVSAQTKFETIALSVTGLRDQCIARLLEIPGVVLNGSSDDRVANNINISIPGLDSEFAVVCLDEAGIAISTKSACSGASGGGSRVVATISNDAARASSTLRITLGLKTSKKELDYFVVKLREHIEWVRETSPVATKTA